MKKRRICCDFDGVIHSYLQDWEGPTTIPDRPVDGSLYFIRRILESEEFKLAINSARSRHEGGIEAIKNWLFHWGLKTREIEAIEFPEYKPAAWLYIDDRGFCFEGIFPSMQFLRDFKPWNRR